LDPNATPWRSLDSDAPVQDETPPRSSPPVMAIAAGAGAVLLAAAAFLLAFGSGNGALVVAEGEPLPFGSGVVATLQPGGAELVVEIVGAVGRPGVYRLPQGSRIGELVTAAGGYSSRVDVDLASSSLNLAALLADGDQVRVPSRDDAPGTPAGGDDGGPVAGNAGGPIDINAATSAQLEELPGIGPATAAKIIAAREERLFTSVDELRSRNVLGEKTFEKVRPLVVVH
jgi:competence protein ComEA